MTDAADTQVIDVYQRHGHVWAGLRTTQKVERDWLDRFCALIPPGAAIVDIGCGSGVPIARGLIDRGFDVTGVDGSTNMLALFRHNLPGVAAWQMDMRQLALDRRGMFARFQAHAAPGAALMFTTGPEEGCAIGELGGDPLYHGSLGPGEYRARLDETGFDLVDHVVADPGCDRTVWLARQRG